MFTFIINSIKRAEKLRNLYFLLDQIKSNGQSHIDVDTLLAIINEEIQNPKETDF